MKDNDDWQGEANAGFMEVVNFAEVYNPQKNLILDKSNSGLLGNSIASDGSDHLNKDLK